MGLVKIAYYALWGLTALISGLYLLGMLFSNRTATGRSKEDAILLLGFAVLAGFMYYAYRLGHLQQQWGYGLGINAAGIVVYFIVVVGGILMFGNVRWN